MNKILSIILIVVLALSFVSCSKKGEKAASAGNRNVTSKTGEIDEEDDIQIENVKIKESDLSEKYRTDLVPIFKGSVIMTTMESPNHDIVGVGCYTKKSYEEVKKYYQDIMSKYEIRNEQEYNDPDPDELPTYYIDAQLGEKLYAAVYIIDVSNAPDDYFEGEDKLPKNARTAFSLQYVDQGE